MSKSIALISQTIVVMAVIAVSAMSEPLSHTVSATNHANPTNSLPDNKNRTAMRLQWNRKSLVQAYDTIGKRSPRWDKDARRALEMFAEMHSHVEDFTEIPIAILDAAHAAVTNGCDDALIRYFNMRWEDRTESFQLPQRIAESIERATALEKTQYSPFRKFNAYFHITDYLPNEYAPKAGEYFLQALQDKMMPIEEVYSSTMGLVDRLQHSEKFLDFYNRAEPILMKNWPNDSEIWTIKGYFYIQYAWVARGDGLADTVTEEGARLMEERLGKAEKALTKAWEINPHDARIARWMLTLELGQRKGRDRMEMWFQRAMRLNTNYYEACVCKLYYLEPKWYGSREDMLEFGHQCVTNSNWGPAIPLILVDAHEKFAEYLSPSERGNYWKDPTVWNDIKLAYNAVFSRTPDISYRKKFLQYALRAGDQAEIIRQLALIEKVEHPNRSRSL